MLFYPFINNIYFWLLVLKEYYGLDERDALLYKEK